MKEFKTFPSTGDSTEKSTQLSPGRVSLRSLLPESAPHPGKKLFPRPTGEGREREQNSSERHSEGEARRISHKDRGQSLPQTKAKFAFTLAEVLITLGVIGVVAAMTMPVLMTAFAKHRVETKLVKFYSMINQTVRMSVADNETPEGWITQVRTYTYNENVEFLKTYIFPYLKISDYKNCSTRTNNSAVCITNLDGTFWRFSIDSNGGDIVYLIDGESNDENPRNKFVFQFAKYNSSESDKSLQSQNFVEPYTFEWDGTKEDLKNNVRGCYKGCTVCALCTKMIQLNSWKIPDDYPW